jgi:hypothetical protein
MAPARRPLPTPMLLRMAGCTERAQVCHMRRFIPEVRIGTMVDLEAPGRLTLLAPIVRAVEGVLADGFPMGRAEIGAIGEAAQSRNRAGAGGHEHCLFL